MLLPSSRDTIRLTYLACSPIRFAVTMVTLGEKPIDSPFGLRLFFFHSRSRPLSISLTLRSPSAKENSFKNPRHSFEPFFPRPSTVIPYSLPMSSFAQRTPSSCCLPTLPSLFTRACFLSRLVRDFTSTLATPTLQRLPRSSGKFAESPRQWKLPLHHFNATASRAGG